MLSDLDAEKDSKAHHDEQQAAEHGKLAYCSKILKCIFDLEKIKNKL